MTRPGRIWRRLVMLLTVAAAIGGCEQNRAYLLGVQDGSADRIVTELVASSLRLGGARVVPVPCGNLRSCIQSLRSGEIDLLPAYSGDAVALVHASRTMQRHESLAWASRAFASLDLRLIADLGFQAPYVAVATKSLSETAAITSIGDLSKIAGGLSLAVPPGYVERPGDGLNSLIRRHGLTVAAGQVSVENDVMARLAMVREGAVDAAIIRDFGINLEEMGLVVLNDERNFFPPYDALLLASSAVDGQESWLRDNAGRIAGLLEPEDLGKISRDVFVRGWSPRDAVLRLLAEKGVQNNAEALISQPPVEVALSPDDEFVGAREMASRTVTRAFPGRPVEIAVSEDPLAALESGEAQLALVDSARLFTQLQDLDFAHHDPRAEAIVSLGQRFLFVIQPMGADPSRNPLQGEIGIPPQKSSGARVARAILRSLGTEPAMHAERDTLLSAVESGRLDAAIMIAASEPLAVSEALRTNKIRVQGLIPWIADAPIMLNESRLPSGTFTGQTGPVDTLSMQLLLVGLSPGTQHPLRAGGPATAISFEGRPMSRAEAEALVRASDSGELPDPIHETIWARAPSDQGGRQRQDRTEIIDTAINVAVLIFIGWCLLLLIRREKGD